jgi:hypothetical protein
VRSKKCKLLNNQATSNDESAPLRIVNRKSRHKNRHSWRRTAVRLNASRGAEARQDDNAVGAQTLLLNLQALGEAVARTLSLKEINNLGSIS